MYTTSDPRRSVRITPTELVKREKALLKKEQECKRKADELDERFLTLSKKEDEASLMLLQMAEREAKAMLEQLEEHFTCSLCVFSFSTVLDLPSNSYIFASGFTDVTKSWPTLTP